MTNTGALTRFILNPWHFLMLCIAGWINRCQQQAIDYLMTEKQSQRNRTCSRTKTKHVVGHIPQSALGDNLLNGLHDHGNPDDRWTRYDVHSCRDGTQVAADSDCRDHPISRRCVGAADRSQPDRPDRRLSVGQDASPHGSRFVIPPLPGFPREKY